MVQIHVTVDVIPSDQSTEITLPSNSLADIMSPYKGSEYQISDWDVPFPKQEDFDDIYLLNDALQKINDAVPELTTDLLSQILIESDMAVTDPIFIQRMCDKQFMLDFIEEPGLEDEYYSAGEQCAYYLAVDLGISFAKNITDRDLVRIALSETVDIYWDVIWNHYSKMGFCAIVSDDKIYVFHI